MTANTSIFVSVIVPTYKDWDTLRYCLQALQNQDWPIVQFEVIIANNDPTTPKPDDLTIQDNVRIIDVEKPGSYSARNAAVRESRGEVLAFTDSDCIPASDWLSSAVAILVEGKTERVAGKISVFRPEGGSGLVYRYEKYTSFRQDNYVIGGFCATANLVTWRRLLDEVGPFNEDMLSGGDKEWNLRATAADKSLMYCENCVVQHPSRKSMAQLKQKIRRLAGGHYTRDKTSYKRLINDIIPGRLLLVMCVRLQGPWYDRPVVFFVGYWLQLYRTYMLMKLHSGRESPSRV